MCSGRGRAASWGRAAGGYHCSVSQPLGGAALPSPHWRPLLPTVLLLRRLLLLAGWRGLLSWGPCLDGPSWARLTCALWPLCSSRWWLAAGRCLMSRPRGSRATILGCFSWLGCMMGGRTGDWQPWPPLESCHVCRLPMCSYGQQQAQSIQHAMPCAAVVWCCCRSWHLPGSTGLLPVAPMPFSPAVLLLMFPCGPATPAARGDRGLHGVHNTPHTTLGVGCCHVIPGSVHNSSSVVVRGIGAGSQEHCSHIPLATGPDTRSCTMLAGNEAKPP